MESLRWSRFDRHALEEEIERDIASYTLPEYITGLLEDLVQSGQGDDITSTESGTAGIRYSRPLFRLLKLRVPENDRKALNLARESTPGLTYGYGTFPVQGLQYFLIQYVQNFPSESLPSSEKEEIQAQLIFTYYITQRISRIRLLNRKVYLHVLPVPVLIPYDIDGNKIYIRSRFLPVVDPYQEGFLDVAGKNSKGDENFIEPKGKVEEVNSAYQKGYQKYIFRTPLPGYTTLSLRTSVEDLFSDGSSRPCGGLSTEAVDFQDLDGNNRYWLDCSKFYFDGEFNVVEASPGYTFFHGSVPLAVTNTAYPVGIQAMVPGVAPKLPPAVHATLEDPEVPKDEKDELLRKHLPLSISFYDSLETARYYSSQGSYQTGEEKFTCGEHCVMAYTLTRPAVFLNLFDPLNLYKLLTEDWIPEEEKQFLARRLGIDITELRRYFQDFQAGIFPNLPEYLRGTGLGRIDNTTAQVLQAYQPFHRIGFQDVSRGTFRDKTNKDPYHLPDAIVQMCKERGYAGYANARSPYLRGKGAGYFRFSELVFSDEVLNYLERDYQNEHDWQYGGNERAWDLLPNFKILCDDMKQYQTWNVDHHAGNLYEHSTWAALHMQQFFRTGSPWVAGIDKEHGRFAILAAFLHDIGKSGDLQLDFYAKEDHPEHGGEYIRGTEEYMLSSEETLDLTKVWKELKFTSDDIAMLDFLVSGHWDYGAVMRDYGVRGAQIYIDACEKRLEKAGVRTDLWKQAILINIALSAADILAAQPFVDLEMWRERTGKPRNTYVAALPVLSNVGKVHRGGNLYEKYDFQGKGLQLREKVIRLLR